MTNATPHLITVVGAGSFPRTELNGQVLTVRAEVKSVQVGEVEGIPLFRTTFGEPYFALGNDKYQGNFEGMTTPFIVSLVALQAIEKNGGLEQFTPEDFVSPGALVRDDQGNIVGCNGFNII